MGLIKKDGDTIKGVFISPVYAKIISLSAFQSEEQQDILNATFGISSSRENLDNNLVLHTEFYVCPYDRSEDALFKQAYESAKEDLFIG